MSNDEFQQQQFFKMDKTTALNFLIKNLADDKLIKTDDIRDGYHSFGELYAHRITLFIAFCKMLCDAGEKGRVWKSQWHADSTRQPGWFILGIDKEPGKQITYHLPMDYWDQTSFVTAIENAPEWDGHTSEDVLKRLKILTDVT
jgi:hypothetical protein